MAATIEIKARWCYECGTDLFLSNSPLVITEEIVVCDVCRGMNRKIFTNHQTYPCHEPEPAFRPAKESLTVGEIWSRFHLRILYLNDYDDEEDVDEYEEYRSLIRRAENAVVMRDAETLIEAIMRALRCSVCQQWERRLRLCLTEAERLISTRD